MYFHKFAVAALAASIMLGSALASATPSTYSYLRTIDFGTTVSGSVRITCATGDANGDIIFTDNGDDSVYHMNPLTANDLNDVDVIFPTATVADPFGHSSFEGITVATSGDVFASGVYDTDNPSTGVMLRITPNATDTAWDVNLMTGLQSKGCGGVTAVGPDTLAVSSLTDGGIDFYSVDTASNSLTPIGSTVAGGGTGDAITVAADTIHSKIYQSITVAPNTQGRVDVFDLGGTPTNPTATYNSGANPLIAGQASDILSTDSTGHYQQVKVKADEQIVAVAVNPGAQDITTDGDYLGLFDASAGGTNLTPYQKIDGSDTGDGQFGQTWRVLGHTFFTKGGQDYLLVYVEQANKFYGTVFIYQKNSAAVSEWSVY